MAAKKKTEQEKILAAITQVGKSMKAAKQKADRKAEAKIDKMAEATAKFIHKGMKAAEKAGKKYP